jgi:histidinol-phosphate aminotransferase
LLTAFGGPGRSALGFTPAYSMHPVISRCTGTRWIDARRLSADDPDRPFEVTVDLAVTQVRHSDPDLVFLCSPNNPTGTALSPEVIEAVYDVSRGMVVVDEAYAEFSRPGTPSALSLLPSRERLVVSRTMSKAFALAGARVGYLAAHPAVADALRLVRMPYHLSSLTQASARAALWHADLLLETVQQIIVERDRIIRDVADLGLRPLPSDANFVLFGGLRDEAAVWRGLLSRGVLIRDVGLPGYLRVTAGTTQETSVFLDALADTLLDRPVPGTPDPLALRRETRVSEREEHR